MSAVPNIIHMSDLAKIVRHFVR